MLIMLMLQITIGFRNENPDTFASCNCIKDPLPYIKVVGVAFSLIVIMLQAKFLYVRVHPLAVLDILPKGKFSRM